MPTPAAGAASPHCMTALVQHHLQGERGCEPSAALQGCAHTTALTSPATRTSQPSPPAAASPSPYPAWPPRRKEVEDCRALQGLQGVMRWGKEPQAWPAAVVTRRGQLCVRLGHTWSLLYLRAQGPMPCMTRAAKEHLPDSTASVAASSMEGNQSARAVSCRAGGYGGGSWGAQTAAPTRTELRGAHADQRRPGWREGKEKK